MEVSSAGRLLMALAEAARATVCLAAALLVALWEPLGNSLVPLMAVGGAGALVAAAFFAYFLHPGTLNPAFDHQRLVLSFETLALVKRLGCFWLSLAVAGADATALAVYATLVLAARGAMVRGGRLAPLPGRQTRTHTRRRARTRTHTRTHTRACIAAIALALHAHRLRPRPA